MRPTTIGIKELHGKLSEVAEAARRGKSFLVMRHARPVFRIEPVASDSKKTYTLDDLRPLMFRSKDKSLSKGVDRAVYGV